MSAGHRQGGIYANTRLRLPAVMAVLVLLAFVVPVCARNADQDAAVLLRNGRAALEDGQYALAEKQFRASLAKAKKGSPEAAEYVILLARALYGQKKYDEMLELLSSGRGAPHAFWRAMARYESRQYDKALGELEDFAKKYADDEYAVRAERLQSHCFLQSGRTNDALLAFARIEQGRADSPEKAANLLDWAMTLASAGDPAAACGTLELLVKRFPDTGEGQQGRHLLGRLLTGMGRMKEAEEVLCALAAQETATVENRCSARLSLADLYEARNRHADATNVLRQVIDLAASPGIRRRGVISLGRLLLRMKMPDEASALLKPDISAVPPDPSADVLQLELAAAFLETGNAPRAVEEYQRYLETFTNVAGRAPAYSGKGWAMLMLPKPPYEEAVLAFRQAYELSDDPQRKAESQMKIADARFSNGQFGLATQAYARVMTEFPASPLVPQAKFQVAESTARAGQTDDAERLFRALIDMDPGGLFADKALLRIAELREVRGDMPGALATYGQFMAAGTNRPLYANALHGHGLVNYRMLEFDAALRDFDELVRAFPQSEPAEQAFYMRGWCHQRIGNGDKAASICREFGRVYPRSKWAPCVAFWLGEYSFNHGDHAGAEKQFLDLAATHPQDPLAASALLWAGKSAARQKEYLRANEHFAALAKKYPDSGKLPYARYGQGDALTEIGEFSNAILLFEEIIKKHPDLPVVDPAWMRKGDCEFGLGRDDTNRYEAAIVSYGMVVGSATAPPELRLQAQYKIGKCLIKLDRKNEAFEQFYTRVVLAYLGNEDERVRHDAACEAWFTRAAFDCVEMLESQNRWWETVRLLKRVVDAGVSASGEAQKRIDRVRLQHLMIPF